MDAIAIGPLLISVPRLYAIVVTLMLLGASAFLLGLPRKRHGRWFNGLLLCWLVGARLGYVLTHWSAYQDTPLAIVKLWLPGYSTVWGLVAALLWSLWYLRDRIASLLGALGLTVVASLAWLALVTWGPLGSAPMPREVPALTLEDIDGNPVELNSLTGKPLIINLWATWCPPCRREMPLLENTAKRDDVTVVVANQGEDLLSVTRYLDAAELDFRYALLDPSQHLLTASESPGLPTTLLFDVDGKLVERHIGELTQPLLDGWLHR
ncbi:TlpA disulfide reductase family protein [Halomonas binhaiensis]|uniref:TlpA family protein disulfide reductase n=1 Tax=Halomonas binhaiensis TaxID=2562282 RepID=A0A5C1NBD3_9GAMM|nr:TlpA disulfide reductase family protein [Halomonas binhaiensis]QEM80484.1 TlpA family protein disulfide reductase [Halomonas binhaiensis]